MRLRGVDVAVGQLHALLQRSNLRLQRLVFVAEALDLARFVRSNAACAALDSRKPGAHQLARGVYLALALSQLTRQLVLLLGQRSIAIARALQRRLQQRSTAMKGLGGALWRQRPRP